MVKELLERPELEIFGRLPLGFSWTGLGSASFFCFEPSGYLKYPWKITIF
jgi:hypothetical protein